AMDRGRRIARVAKRRRAATATAKEHAHLMKRDDSRKPKIRRARLQDAARIAELSGQLGYPASRLEIAQRMKRMRPAAQHAIVVAETGKKIMGWLHVSVTPVLEIALCAEVNGLVID